MVAAPLAAGNTMVLLVTPTVSAVALLFAELLHNSGFVVYFIMIIENISRVKTCKARNHPQSHSLFILGTYIVSYKIFAKNELCDLF